MIEKRKSNKKVFRNVKKQILFNNNNFIYKIKDEKKRIF